MAHSMAASKLTPVLLGCTLVLVFVLSHCDVKQTTTQYSVSVSVEMQRSDVRE